MRRYAITFQIRPGTEAAVRKLLSEYAPPDWETSDGTRLLSTSIFMHGTTVVRVIEIDGDLPSVMAHLSRQPGIQRLERELDAYLAVPRDMSDPEGVRAFFASALMDHVTTRVAGPARSEPVQAEPVQAEAVQVEAVRGEAGRAEPAEPFRADPVRGEPVR
ncbi:SchA/CurD-like domain-containing protein [Streptosporangium sp. NPDC000563]|uniref:SchA/CurD-like domain-containing protein n=1 Tax=Streptosporangium sp. NPDC000563 TaxID=3154366 RepID=UPI00332D598B